jgi:hypothetical protein
MKRHGTRRLKPASAENLPISYEVATTGSVRAVPGWTDRQSIRRLATCPTGHRSGIWVAGETWQAEPPALPGISAVGFYFGDLGGVALAVERDH